MVIKIFLGVLLYQCVLIRSLPQQQNGNTGQQAISETPQIMWNNNEGIFVSWNRNSGNPPNSNERGTKNDISPKSINTKENTSASNVNQQPTLTPIYSRYPNGRFPSRNPTAKSSDIGNVNSTPPTKQQTSTNPQTNGNGRSPNTVKNNFPSSGYLPPSYKPNGSSKSNQDQQNYNILNTNDLDSNAVQAPNYYSNQSRGNINGNKRTQGNNAWNHNQPAQSNNFGNQPTNSGINSQYPQNNNQQQYNTPVHYGPSSQPQIPLKNLHVTGNHNTGKQGNFMPQNNQFHTQSNQWQRDPNSSDQQYANQNVNSPQKNIASNSPSSNQNQPNKQETSRTPQAQNEYANQGQIKNVNSNISNQHQMGSNSGSFGQLQPNIRSSQTPSVDLNSNLNQRNSPRNSNQNMGNINSLQSSSPNFSKTTYQSPASTRNQQPSKDFNRNSWGQPILASDRNPNLQNHENSQSNGFQAAVPQTQNGYSYQQPKIGNQLPGNTPTTASETNQFPRNSNQYNQGATRSDELGWQNANSNQPQTNNFNQNTWTNPNGASSTNQYPGNSKQFQSNSQDSSITSPVAQTGYSNQHNIAGMGNTNMEDHSSLQRSSSFAGNSHQSPATYGSQKQKDFHNNGMGQPTMIQGSNANPNDRGLPTAPSPNMNGYSYQQSNNDKQMPWNEPNTSSGSNQFPTNPSDYHSGITNSDGTNYHSPNANSDQNNSNKINQNPQRDSNAASSSSQPFGSFNNAQPSSAVSYVESPQTGYNSPNSNHQQAKNLNQNKWADPNRSSGSNQHSASDPNASPSYEGSSITSPNAHGGHSNQQNIVRNNNQMEGNQNSLQSSSSRATGNIPSFPNEYSNQRPLSPNQNSWSHLNNEHDSNQHHGNFNQLQPIPQGSSGEPPKANNGYSNAQQSGVIQNASDSPNNFNPNVDRQSNRPIVNNQFAAGNNPQQPNVNDFSMRQVPTTNEYSNQQNPNAARHFPNQHSGASQHNQPSGTFSSHNSNGSGSSRTPNEYGIQYGSSQNGYRSQGQYNNVVSRDMNQHNNPWDNNQNTGKISNGYENQRQPNILNEGSWIQPQGTIVNNQPLANPNTRQQNSAGTSPAFPKTQTGYSYPQPNNNNKNPYGLNGVTETRQPSISSNQQPQGTSYAGTQSQSPTTNSNYQPNKNSNQDPWNQRNNAQSHQQYPGSNNQLYTNVPGSSGMSSEPQNEDSGQRKNYNTNSNKSNQPNNAYGTNQYPRQSKQSEQPLTGFSGGTSTVPMENKNQQPGFSNDNNRRLPNGSQVNQSPGGPNQLDNSSQSGFDTISSPTGDSRQTGPMGSSAEKAASSENSNQNVPTSNQPMNPSTINKDTGSDEQNFMANKSSGNAEMSNENSEKTQTVLKNHNDKQPNESENSSNPAKIKGTYMFKFDVKDEEKGLDFGREEKREGQVVQGSYRVLLPDMRIQKVTYTVDGESGFVAELSYEGEAITEEDKQKTMKEQNGADTEADKMNKGMKEQNETTMGEGEKQMDGDSNANTDEEENEEPQSRNITFVNPNLTEELEALGIRNKRHALTTDESFNPIDHRPLMHDLFGKSMLTNSDSPYFDDSKSSVFIYKPHGTMEQIND